METMPKLDQPVPGRVCWLCKHVRFISAEPEYSSWTPGADFHLYCGKTYWEFDTYDDDLLAFRLKLQAAEWCADFVPRVDSPETIGKEAV